MASVGIRCGGGNYNLLGDCRFGNARIPHNRNAPPCLMIGNQTDSSRGKGMSKISAVATPAMSLESVEGRRARQSNKEQPPVAYEKVDRWMRESVEEIVKNLRKAPLLVHLYGRNDEIGGVETKKAVDNEDWAVAKDKWNSGEAPLPESVIFVEELSEKQEEEEDNGQDDVVDGLTKAWGIVVQGRGLECGPACYLLKTTSVGVRSAGSRPGLGCVGCTHFCLVKVNSFWETAESQLSNCWARTYAQEQSAGPTWTGLLFVEDQ